MGGKEHSNDSEQYTHWFLWDFHFKFDIFVSSPLWYLQYWSTHGTIWYDVLFHTLVELIVFLIVMPTSGLNLSSWEVVFLLAKVRITIGLDVTIKPPPTRHARPGNEISAQFQQNCTRSSSYFTLSTLLSF